MEVDVEEVEREKAGGGGGASAAAPAADPPSQESLGTAPMSSVEFGSSLHSFFRSFDTWLDSLDRRGTAAGHL